MKVTDITKFENLNRLSTGGQQCCINVFELTGNDQPQIDLLLYQNHYCLITKLHCLINKDSHMKHVCRRCLTAFSSQQFLIDHIDRCQKQQPTKITFSWKAQLKFEDYYMKVPVPIRVYADFECINQPQNIPNVFLTNSNCSRILCNFTIWKQVQLILWNRLYQVVCKGNVKIRTRSK